MESEAKIKKSELDQEEKVAEHGPRSVDPRTESQGCRNAGPRRNRKRRR